MFNVFEGKFVLNIFEVVVVFAVNGVNFEYIYFKFSL